jgi:hypothetical protein
MKTNILKGESVTQNSTGIGTVTRGMTRDRAAAIAANNGHSMLEVSKSDWEQAKIELAGEQDAAARQTALESIPESKRWDPIPGSAGTMAPVSPSADEDDEGRSDQQRLVEAGVSEAEEDRNLEARRAATS